LGLVRQGDILEDSLQGRNVVFGHSQSYPFVDTTVHADCSMTGVFCTFWQALQ